MEVIFCKFHWDWQNSYWEIKWKINTTEKFCYQGILSMATVIIYHPFCIVFSLCNPLCMFYKLKVSNSYNPIPSGEMKSWKNHIILSIFSFKKKIGKISLMSATDNLPSHSTENCIQGDTTKICHKWENGQD